MVAGLKNKKAQIASTLTWFTAFIIVFFIIILFISATLIVSGKKRVLVGQDEIILDTYAEDNIQMNLIYLLNSKVEYNREVKIKELLKGYLDSEEQGYTRTLIRKKMEEAEQCYNLFVFFNLENEDLTEKGFKVTNAKGGYGRDFGEIASLVLVSGENKIKVELSRCNDGS